LLLYYITDRSQFPGDERQRREQLLNAVGEAARNGIDYIQLRERDLSSRQLEQLSREVVRRIRAWAANTRILINSRSDVALAAGAEGVHLRSNDISPEEVRRIWRQTGEQKDPIIAMSCHKEAEVIAAEKSGADFVVFGPVFGKQGMPTNQAGLDQLRSVCRPAIPVLALGGVTPANAHSCVEAGAQGVAGIRLFQENEIEAVVKRLRGGGRDWEL